MRKPKVQISRYFRNIDATDTPMELTESYVRSTKIPNDIKLKTLSDCLIHHAVVRPDKNAFVFVSADGKREVITWKTLYSSSVSAARGFIQLGVKRHEIVAVNVRTCPDWLYINMGIILAGAIAANISFTYTDGSDVIAMMGKLGSCSAMVLDAGAEDDNNWNIFCKIIDEISVDGAVKSAAMPYLRYVIALERPSNMPNLKIFNDVMEDVHSTVELPVLDEDDIITLFQTSGSTGVPKVAAHTHATLIIKYNQQLPLIMGTFEQKSGEDGLDPSNMVLYNDRPFYWIGGWPNNVYDGMTRVTLSGLGQYPDDIVAFIFDVVKREKCDILLALPQLLHTLMERKADIGSDWSLMSIISWGQPITKAVVNCVGSLCKRLITGYGGTEFGVVTGLSVVDINAFEDYCSGRLLPEVEVKIVDEHETVVPVGVRGEVYTRSSQIFKRYWNDPLKTKSVLTADGCFRTDDIGHLSKEGSLYVEGRKSDMIISGGMKINPAILETAIRKCPDVSTAMVVPIAHLSLYQVVCACIIPTAGSNVMEEDLRRYCESMHNDKQGLFTVLTKYYLIMEEFPQTNNGKTSRKELATLAEALLKRV